MDDQASQVGQIADLVCNLCLVGLVIVALDYLIFGPSKNQDEDDGDK